MALFQQGMFVHDPRHDTPETIAQKRAIIAKIMSSQNAPRTIGDGLNALGDGIVANVLGRRADEAAAAGQESASAAFNPLLDAFRSRTGLDANGFPAAPNPGDSTSMAAMPAPDYASARVAQAHGDGSMPDGDASVGNMTGYIRQAASARGIDPEIAVRVARSEGLAPNVWQSNVINKRGQRETSYGPFQLLVGGGLGDKFQKMYGASPADKSTWRKQIDFALDEAATGGWSPWYGAAKVGVGRRTGLDRARALGYQPSAPAPSPTVASGLTPDVLQQWGQNAYAPAQSNDAPSAVNALGNPSAPTGEWLRYANQGATRNLPVADNLKQAMSFLPEIGVTMDVYSGGQPGKGSGGKRVGSTRHDHGNAADVRFYRDGKQLDWSNEADRPVFQQIVQRARAAGVTGFGAGPGYMGAGTMHIGYGAPGVWGAGGRSANAPDWLKQAYNTPYKAEPNSAVAANEAMATGSLSNGLTPDALQQWAFANYAPQSQGDAVNGLATGTLPDPAQWPDIQRRAMASAPADPATWPQRQAELMRETSPQWLNDMIDGNGVPVAETEADILAQEQAMMAQDPQAFQQPGTQPRLQASAAPQAAPPLPPAQFVQDRPIQGIQTAQAGGFPEMAGRNPQALPAPGIDMQMIANVLTNPFSNPEQRAFAQMLLEQEMQSRDPMRQLDMDYKRAQIDKMQREAATAGDNIFGTPIYGRDPETGQTVLGAMGKDGSFHRLDTGGVEVTPGVTWQDFGTHRQAFDRGGAPVGGPVLRHGDVPSAHVQTPDGGLAPMPGSQADLERRAELAKVEDNAYSIISMIDSLYSDPYLDGMLGPARSRLPNISADAARVQSKMDQIGGQAFLQAFQTLRGGGQISNVEGEKAQAAIARLNTAQSPKDYRQALNELKGIVQTSLDRARRSAGAGAGSNPPPGTSGNGWGDAGIPGVRIRRKQ
jgi:hypothetical protein